MRRGIRPPTPATVLAALALFVALGGTVWAAAAPKIDGQTIKANSMPGNRVVVGSMPANRLQEGSIPGNRLAPGTVTGTEVDSSTLGTVPSAAHASTADDAARALHANVATSAERLDGRRAECAPGTEEFGGACWESSESEATTAPAAAAACASRGGELPDALALAAFAQQPDTTVRTGGEWSGDVTNVSGLDKYAAATVSPEGKVSTAVSTESRRYRCVIPLVH